MDQKFVLLKDEPNPDFLINSSILELNNLDSLIKPKDSNAKKRNCDVTIPLSTIRELFAPNPKMSLTRIQEECDYINSRQSVFKIEPAKFAPVQQQFSQAVLPKKREHSEHVRKNKK